MIRSKQLSALTFCACTVPSILLLPRLGWLVAGIVCIAVALLFCFAKHKKYAKPVSLLLLSWNFIALGAASELVCRAFPNSSLLLGLLLLLLAAFAADRGMDVLLRVAAVVFFFLILLYSVLLGFSLPDLEKSQLVPTVPQNWSVAVAALTPMLSVFLQKENEKCKAPFLFAASVLVVLAALVSAEQADFYTAMKSVSLLGAMERLEPLVSVGLTVGGFCLLGMLCAVNKEIISDLLPDGKKYSMVLNFLLGSAGIYLSRLLGGTILAIGTAIFWGILPIWPQSLEKQKKFEKNEKNA